MKLIALLLALLLAQGCNRDSHKGHTYPSLEDGGIIGIVPWKENGGTDTAFKAVKSQLEKHLGQAVEPAYMPGEGGFKGTKHGYDNRHKKTTLLFGALKTLAIYKRSGKWRDANKAKYYIPQSWWDKLYPAEEPGLDDFRIYSIWKSPESIIAVNCQSNLTTPDSLLRAMTYGSISIATAGEYSAGDIGARTIAKLVHAQYKAIRKPGGRAAVDATVVGETATVVALYSEMRDAIIEGKICPVMMISDIPGIYDNLVIDALGDYVDEHVPENGTTFGFVIAKDSPKETIEALDRAWSLASVADSAETKGVLPRVIYGERARKELNREIDADLWATAP